MGLVSCSLTRLPPVANQGCAARPTSQARVVQPGWAFAAQTILVLQLAAHPQLCVPQESVEPCSRPSGTRPSAPGDPFNKWGPRSEEPARCCQTASAAGRRRSAPRGGRGGQPPGRGPGRPAACSSRGGGSRAWPRGRHGESNLPNFDARHPLLGGWSAWFGLGCPAACRGRSFFRLLPVTRWEVSKRPSGQGRLGGNVHTCRPSGSTHTGRRTWCRAEGVATKWTPPLRPPLTGISRKQNK